MKDLKKLGDIILKIEKTFSSILLFIIFLLVFTSAIARTIRIPINWAQDLALLAFAWITFIGADIVARTNNLINIDMVIKLFPKTFQKIILVIFDILMLVFLLVLIVYGFILVNQSFNRVFNTLKLSYAWCTLSVPVGSILLFITIFEKLIKDIKSFKRNEVSKC